MTRFAGRYVFVGGLHRTGTSLVARLIQAHSQVSGIVHSPAPENEGCFLQGGIPHTAQHGIPGHFATDPAQHHIEGSAFDRAAVRERMEANWDRWFERGGAWRVEKSPVNLTRMRLYQQLFPMAQFVIVLRHPEAMAAALAKWSETPPSRLIDHALDAYTIMASDLPFLHAAFVLRYEDLVAVPERTVSLLHHFLSLKPEPLDPDLRDGNRDYRDSLSMSDEQAARAAHWGYLPGLQVEPIMAIGSHPLRAVREAAGLPG